MPGFMCRCAGGSSLKGGEGNVPTDEAALGLSLRLCSVVVSINNLALGAVCRA